MLVLKLNSTYEPMDFCSSKKAILLFLKGKVEILSSWDKSYRWGSGSMKIPSIIRMKYHIRWIPVKTPFSKSALYRRDNWTCQYCGKKLDGNTITIDHIFPQCFGGKTNFLNCVASCTGCNNFKGNNTPKEAGMSLLSTPRVPNRSIRDVMSLIHPQHEDWEQYIT